MTRPLVVPAFSVLLVSGASFAALLTLASPSVARACSCAPAPAPALAMANSKMVFEGKLISQVSEARRLVGEDGAQAGPELPINVATFEVLRVWKGEDLRVGSTVTIETAGESAACGRDYTPANEWIIYADEREGRLTDGLCSRSGPSDAAAADGDAAALDDAALAAKSPPTSPSPSAGGAPEETKASKASHGGCAVGGEAARDLAASFALGVLLPLGTALGLGAGRRRRRSAARTPRNLLESCELGATDTDPLA